MPSTPKSDLRQAGKHLQKALSIVGRLAKSVASDAAVGATRASRAACEKALGALRDVEAKMTAPAEPAAKPKAKARKTTRKTKTA